MNLEDINAIKWNKPGTERQISRAGGKHSHTSAYVQAIAIQNTFFNLEFN
jgi:hypothetical protein